MRFFFFFVFLFLPPFFSQLFLERSNYAPEGEIVSVESVNAPKLLLLNSSAVCHAE